MSDTRLTAKEVCEKYPNLTASKIRTLVNKGIIRVEMVKGKRRFNGHDLRRLAEGSAKKKETAESKITHEALKAKKTEEEIIKLKLNNRETIEKIKDEENVKFKKHLNKVFSNFSNWPMDLKFTPQQQSLWNNKLDEVADMIQKLEQEDKEAEHVISIA